MSRCKCKQGSVGVRRILVVPRDSGGASAGFCWCVWGEMAKWLHHAKAQPHRGVLRWEWGNKDVHLVTTVVFCYASKYYFFSAGVSLWKRVRKMRKSGTGHANGIGFRGHDYVMHSKNSSLPAGNKMIELSNIDSYHETLIHIAYRGCACSLCAQIIQRILWCYNGFCDFH